MRHLNTRGRQGDEVRRRSRETEALAMVTLNPAKQLGIDNRVGSIEVGKDADLVIYDKYPLSDYAKVQKVLIDGTVYFDRDKEVSDAGGQDGGEAEADRKTEARSSRRPAAAGAEAGVNEIRQGFYSDARWRPSPAGDSFFIRNVDVYPWQRQGDDGRLGADAGRQDRRYRRQAGSAEGHQNRRGQGPARLSRHDRLRRRTSACPRSRGPRVGGHGRDRRVHAAASRAQRGQSGERALRRGPRQRHHQRDDPPGRERRGWRRTRRRTDPAHSRHGGADPHFGLHLGRDGGRARRGRAAQFPEPRRTGRTRRRRSARSPGDVRRPRQHGGRQRPPPVRGEHRQDQRVLRRRAPLQGGARTPKSPASVPTSNSKR